MKIITDPKETGFRFLKLLGTILTFLGLLLFLGILAYIVLGVVPYGAGPMGSALSLLSLSYPVVVIMAGQLLHWTVAIWESHERTNALLSQHMNPGG